MDTFLRRLQRLRVHRAQHMESGDRRQMDVLRKCLLEFATEGPSLNNSGLARALKAAFEPELTSLDSHEQTFAMQAVEGLLSEIEDEGVKGLPRMLETAITSLQLRRRVSAHASNILRSDNLETRETLREIAREALAAKPAIDGAVFATVLVAFAAYGAALLTEMPDFSELRREHPWIPLTW